MDLAQSAPDTGSPVNPVLGASVLADDEDLDATFAGPLPLELQRSYCSINTSDGWFGRGWSCRLEVRLEAVPSASGEFVDHVDCINTFGQRITFPALELDSEFFSPQEKLTLARTPLGQYSLTTPEGLTYWFGDRSMATYRLAAITDRNGNTIGLDYHEANGQINSVQILCSGKQQLELGFQNGRLREIVELRESASGVQRLALMNYEYTPQGDLRRVTNRANECVRRFEYDAQRRIQRQEYATVFEAWYDYSGSGEESKVIRYWDNVGQSWTFDYHSTHTVVTDQAGRRSIYHIDADRRWTGLTNPLDEFTRYGVDRKGNLRAVIDPAENVTEILFDERSNPVEERDATGAVTIFEWHPTMPLLTAITDPLDRVMRYEYDERGNFILEVDPTGAETRYIPDARGLIVEIIDATGKSNLFVYNDRGQITQETDCSGQVTRYDYNEDGHLVCITDALDQQSFYRYDAVGRLLRETRPDGGYDAYGYDGSGRLTSITNSLGATSRGRYDPDGLIVEEINAIGDSLQYRYDSCRRLAELINENGASHRFSYDALDRIVEETRFDGSRSLYSYDSAGLLVESVDEPESSEAIRKRYAYDGLGHLLERSTSSSQATFGYDAAGQLIQASTEEVTVTFQYDKAGQVIEESVTIATEERVVRHAYDPLGNRASTTLPDGTQLSTLYYGSGHAHQLSLDNQSIAEFERDGLHREVKRTQGALNTTRRYSPAGHLLEQRAQSSVAPVASSPPQEIDRSFSYDDNGRLVAVLSRGKQLTYGYDDIDRLTSFNDQKYLFDPAHNIVAANGSEGSTAAPTRDNRLKTYEGSQYRFDAHGRVIEKELGRQDFIQFRWDEEHRLLESSTHNDRGTTTTRYLYDAIGRRVAKWGPQGRIRYTWDEDILLQQSDEHNDYTFVMEPEQFVPLAQLVSKRPPDEQAPDLYYYHCDQVGLPQELTDVDGQIVWEGSYRGWGQLDNAETDEEHAGSQGDAPLSTLRYQGQSYDTETGLHYNLMRYYDPLCGRFISRDPIGLLGGVNEYLYSPNPTGWIDPWGLTGTYIMSGGKTKNYVGKGPEARSKASARERIKGCQKQVVTHTDYGDSDMGFMVEHLVMVDTGAQLSPNYANSQRLSSPGKKKYAAADAATRKKARAKAAALKKKHAKEKKACGL